MAGAAPQDKYNKREPGITNETLHCRRRNSAANNKIQEDER